MFDGFACIHNTHETIVALEQAGFQYPAEYQLPSSKKVRLEDGTDITRDFPELAYPDTDTQYATATEGGEQPADAQRAAMPVPPPPAYRGTRTESKATEETKTSTGPDNESKKRSLEQLHALPPRNAYEEEEEDDDEEDETGQKSADTAQQSQAAPSAWTAHMDPDTGATYFYNDQTGESSWETPAGVDEATLLAQAQLQQQQQFASYYTNPYAYTYPAGQGST